MTAFTQAFKVLIGEEGGYCNEPEDPGNYTGGKVGVGQQLGTKFGVDSASYADVLRELPPEVRATMPTAVKDLTLDQAQAIYKACYWDKVAGDDLPGPLAMMVFDAAVNNGVGRAARWLQAAVDVEQDGDIGPGTLKAIDASVKTAGGAALCAEFLALRMMFMASLPTWRVFGKGWSRRLASLPFQAMAMGAA